MRKLFLTALTLLTCGGLFYYKSTTLENSPAQQEFLYSLGTLTFCAGMIFMLIYSYIIIENIKKFNRLPQQIFDFEQACDAYDKEYEIYRSRQIQDEILKTCDYPRKEKEQERWVLYYLAEDVEKTHTIVWNALRDIRYLDCWKMKYIHDKRYAVEKRYDDWFSTKNNLPS